MKLARTRRQNVKKILVSKTAADYREEQFEKLSTEYEPLQLKKTIIYRKAREEATHEEIGYHEFKGLSITSEKLINFCDIKKLCLVPFYLIYYSKAQIEIWNAICEQSLPLSIDATGSLVKTFTHGPYKRKSTFYYVLVVGVGGKSIPLLQALLSIHHVSLITEVLENWIGNGTVYSYNVLKL